MGTESEYERYEEPYSYEVRDRRVRGARGLQAVDGLTTSAAFDEAAERYRDYNISKREFVLARESVAYGDYASLEDDLEAAFSEFRPAPAQGSDYTTYIASVADFIARIWQIHPFAEGNTRTVAVFLQQLLHFHGFPQDRSEAFDRSSLQFRNALVRANCRNIPLGVEPDPTFLREFIGCLIAGRPFPYRNRDMASAELFRSKGLIPPQEENPQRTG